MSKRKGKSAKQNTAENEEAQESGPPPVDREKLIRALVSSRGREGIMPAKVARINKRLSALNYREVGVED